MLSYQRKDPRGFLMKVERAKKKKCLQPCLDRRRHFTLLVYSVDGMHEEEVVAVQKRLAFHLAAKWGHQYSEMCGYVWAMMALAIVL
eukprot:157544-Ditylum_brightwellii.AAC.1